VKNKVVKGPYKANDYAKLIRGISRNRLISGLFNGKNSEDLDLEYISETGDVYAICNNVGNEPDKSKLKDVLLTVKDNEHRNTVDRSSIGVELMSRINDPIIFKNTFLLMMKIWTLQCIIGQGDAGPHNLLLKKSTGDIITVDFDDYRPTYDFETENLFKFVLNREIGDERKNYPDWIKEDSVRNGLINWLDVELEELVSGKSDLIMKLEKTYFYEYDREIMKKRLNKIKDLLK
jgi:hypothetical protein